MSAGSPVVKCRALPAVNGVDTGRCLGTIGGCPAPSPNLYPDEVGRSSRGRGSRHFPGAPRRRPVAAGGWIRSHWMIENSLHWVRDVTDGEDHSRVRTGHGPQVMAALRNTAINIIRLRGGTNIAAAHRHFSYRPADVLDALTTA